MIKKTLYFENPAYLSLKNKQLVIKLPEVEKNDSLPDSFKAESVKTIPVEDIGIVILDNKQITITHGLLTALLENNAAFIQCNDNHHPVGMMLNLDGHTLQTQRFKAQIEATEPLKKQLWQQTVIAKIENQATLLSSLDKEVKKLEYLSSSVKSGDTDNCEARAAAYYWSIIFADHVPDFQREREGIPPNNLLNYGYVILRAAVARALVGSGLLPTRLADDIMEPYRPFVDKAVLEIVRQGNSIEELSLCAKRQLMSVLQQDIYFERERSPLLVGITQTTASLVACFEGSKRKIVYPKLNAAK